MLSDSERNIKRRLARLENIDEIRRKEREYREKNIDEIKQKKKDYYLINKEKFLKRQQKQQYKEKKKEWAKNNKDKARIYYEKESARKKRRENYARRMACDPQFVLKRRLRSSLRQCLKRINAGKFTNTQKILGCNWNSFKNYIESLFENNMSWNDIKNIHIDHYIPSIAFDLTKKEEQIIFQHYSNLRPMWGKDNQSKNDNMPSLLSIDILKICLKIQIELINKMSLINSSYILNFNDFQVCSAGIISLLTNKNNEYYHVYVKFDKNNFVNILKYFEERKWKLKDKN